MHTFPKRWTHSTGNETFHKQSHHSTNNRKILQAADTFHNLLHAPLMSRLPMTPYMQLDSQRKSNFERRESKLRSLYGHSRVALKSFWGHSGPLPCLFLVGFPFVAYCLSWCPPVFALDSWLSLEFSWCSSFFIYVHWILFPKLLNLSLMVF